MSKLALEIAHQMDAVAISPEHDFRDMEELVRAAKEFDLHLVYGLNCFYPYLLRELKGTHTIVGGGLVSASSGFESDRAEALPRKALPGDGLRRNRHVPQPALSPLGGWRIGRSRSSSGCAKR